MFILACPEWVAWLKFFKTGILTSTMRCRVSEDFMQGRVRINVQLPKGFLEEKVPPGQCMRAWHFH
jgi:hypothetical protein